MKIWNSIVGLFDSMCRARAAAELTRRGMHKEARQLMLG